MTKWKWITAAMFISMIMSSCFINIDDDDGFFGCTDGDGPIITEEIFLSDFDGIRLSSSINVYLTQGDDQKVVVEGKANLIEILDRDVNGGIWEIDFEDCVRDVDEFNVFITLPMFKAIQIDGSGDVYSENTLLTGDLDIDIEGSGDLDLAIEADDIDVGIEGSGEVTLEGFADYVKYRIDGSGDVKAFDLECQTADISISGSGDIEVLVIELLKVRIDGSGTVRYKGTPELDVDISGSGEVIDAN
jgi:hypothetical protein